MDTQCNRIVDYVKNHGSITAREAMNELGVFRLAARISDLKDVYDIRRDMITVKNRFGEDCRIARYSFDV